MAFHWHICFHAKNSAKEVMSGYIIGQENISASKSYSMNAAVPYEKLSQAK